MRQALLLLASAIVLSAQTWEVGLFANRIDYSDPSMFIAISTGGERTGGVARKTATGIRAAYAPWVNESVSLEATLGYQPPVKSPAYVHSSFMTLDFRTIEWSTQGLLETSWVGAGLMLMSRTSPSLGLGFELRREQLALSGTQGTLTSPWFRFRAVFEIPAPKLHPFLGIDMNYCPNSRGSSDDQVLALAPKRELGICCGIRF